ncbi:T-complex protein 1 zeta subunit [Spraguea lophii 42_110]|uniref:T-complex protein 1 zeta subunit n=1 Tax=Spraguea lophii (strain 42_110) TaxID=1358809 RepID=S7WE59_SPRLO|nr:T-complex protein 1 zeta subunit [Spraguea lophii 42_110]
MSFLSKETEITQSGQAIHINAVAANALSSMFSTNIGPNGTYKLLVSPSNSIKISNDGNTLLREIQFIHPTSIIINKSAQQTFDIIGDGSSRIIVYTSELFLNGFKYFQDGVSIFKIVRGMKIGRDLMIKYLNENKMGIEKGTLIKTMEKLAYNQLSTKMESFIAKKLSLDVVKALTKIKTENGIPDTNMVEVLKMPEGDIADSQLINGLVLDHGGRHHAMPTKMKDVIIMITNISLEYEKPEINAGFYYSSAEERDKLVGSERQFIYERAKRIAEFGRELKNQGKSLLVITEKGIDPVSLEVLANEGILALRRAKRRNLERLVKMCGGNIINRVEDLKLENMGYCGKVRVEDIKDEKFTFLEDTPYSGSCTILVRGNQYEMDRMITAVKNTLKSLLFVLKDSCYLQGGPILYYKISEYLENQKKNCLPEDVVGIDIIKNSILSLTKILLKNSNKNVEEEIEFMRRGKIQEGEETLENYQVVLRVLGNAVMVAISLLMVDEIIKAGKSVKEEGDGRKQ